MCEDLSIILRDMRSLTIPELIANLRAALFKFPDDIEDSCNKCFRKSGSFIGLLNMIIEERPKLSKFHITFDEARKLIVVLKNWQSLCYSLKDVTLSDLPLFAYFAPSNEAVDNFVISLVAVICASEYRTASIARHNAMVDKLKSLGGLDDLIKEDTPCVICSVVELSTNSNVAILDCCQHVFCPGCFKRWLTEKR